MKRATRCNLKTEARTFAFLGKRDRGAGNLKQRHGIDDAAARSVGSEEAEKMRHADAVDVA
jgi:hypothetical protein